MAQCDRRILAAIIFETEALGRVVEGVGVLVGDVGSIAVKDDKLCEMLHLIEVEDVKTSMTYLVEYP